MTRQSQFTVKHDFGISEPLILRVLSPSRDFTSLYDNHPLNTLHNFKKIQGKNRIEYHSPRQTVEAWLTPEIKRLGSMTLLWGEDNVGCFIPPATKDLLSYFKNANRKSLKIFFAYRKRGGVPVIVSGTPRRIDTEKGLIVLETAGLPYSRNFLISEIIGLYADSVFIVYPWRFRFEPAVKGRTSVTVDFDYGFERTVPRRRARNSSSLRENPSAPAGASKPIRTPQSFLNLLAPQQVDGSELLGEIFELITPTGDRLGLRVEYVKPTAVEEKE
jgi:hypothetical protein